MKFTGERYIPTEQGEIRHEHLHRYAWCAPLVVDKDVLDIACGEGYGSALLVRSARSVQGVDISGEAVEHATAKYGDTANLGFKVGNAAAIPLPDDSFDVVVSFETIEHHDRHSEMLAEIRRVLRPGGILVISSPNRVVYSELAGHHNEFHVKELDFAEFDAVLREQFDSVRYFGQRLAVGSSIFGLESDASSREFVALTDTGSEVVERTASLADPVYYVAVAGLPEDELSKLRPSVLFSEAEDLYTHHREVARWAVGLDKELSDLRTDHGKLVKQHADTVEWAKSLDADLVAASGHIHRLQGEKEESITWARGLDEELSDARRRIEQLQEEQAKTTAWAQSRDTELGGVRQQLELSRKEHERASALAGGLGDELSAAHRRIEQLQEEQAKTSAWAQSRDAELGQVRQQLELSGKRCERANILASELSDELSAVRRHIDQLQEEHAKTIARAMSSDAELEEVRHQLELANIQIGVKIHEIETLEQGRAEMECWARDIERKLDRVGEGLLGLEFHGEGVEGDRSNLLARYLALHEQTLDDRVRNAHLTGKLASLQSDVGGATHDSGCVVVARKRCPWHGWEPAAAG